MAFLGDFGRYFLGGKTTQEVGRDTGQAIDLYFGGTGQQGAAIGDNIGSSLGKIGSTADQPNEQSAVPTGGKDGGAQEDSRTGSQTMNQANLTNIPALFSGARNLFNAGSKFFSTQGGNIATGVGTGVAFNMMSGNGQDMRMKPVLTQSRRNKSRVRQLVNFMGIEGAANFLSQAGGREITGNDVVQLLLRTFRNDGAYITKAQVRNLRRTTNRFKSLEKQVKEATSMSRTTRRAPVRRTGSTTLIKN